MLNEWNTIQDAISNQTVSDLLQHEIQKARNSIVCKTEGERPTVFILASAVNGADGKARKCLSKLANTLRTRASGRNPLPV